MASQGVLARVGAWDKKRVGEGSLGENLCYPLEIGKSSGRDAAADGMLKTSGYFWGLVLEQLKEK